MSGTVLDNPRAVWAAIGNQTAVYNQGQQLNGQIAGNNGTGQMQTAGTAQGTLNTALGNVGGTTARVKRSPARERWPRISVTQAA